MELSDFMGEKEMKVLEVLNNYNIKFEKIEHPPVYTVEDAKKHCDFIDVGSKNLFLKDSKSNNYFLVSLLDTKRADLKLIANQINIKKLTFASEQELNTILGLSPGEVTPFGLINDTDKKVTFLIDNELEHQEKVAFHPNVNSSTLLLKYDEFEKFLNYLEIDFIKLDV